MSQDSGAALSDVLEQMHINTSSDEPRDSITHEHTVYRPLNRDLKEIRLFEVAPSTYNDIVTCTLKHVSLLSDPKPLYETISYCGGTPRDYVFIMLDGCMVPVPPSSEAAVRRMRLSDRPRVLWLDAICID